MAEMIELFDNFSWDKHEKMITQKEHGVPGLGNFTYSNNTSSVMPSPLHYHSNIFELHCMVKGKRYTQIETDGHITQYNVTGNQAMMVFPFEIHSNGNDPQYPCEFYAFQINVSDPYHLLGLNQEYSYALYEILSQMKATNTHMLSIAQTHLNYLRSSFNFFAEQKKESTKIGVQFLTSFLFTLQFLQPIKVSQVSAVSDRLMDALSYIHNNIERSISLSDLASVSGYSLSRFKYRFREEMGITPSEYITLQKVEKAKYMLTKTTSNITDIAYALGFSSSNYFSSVFKKICACTPKDYRKMCIGRS